MNKTNKQIKYMILGVTIFWIIVLIVLVVKKNIIKKHTDELGAITVLEEDEDIAYEDPYEDSDEMPLLDTGYITFYDDSDMLSQQGFITLKGHIYLPESLTNYLMTNGYTTVETITVIPESCTQEKQSSSFVAHIDGTDEYIKVTQSYLTEDFEFEILKTY